MEENRKKQVPLRLSPQLYADIAKWAEDDFRSINGQIEYLLSECVRRRKQKGKHYIPKNSNSEKESNSSESENS
ncbi:MAG: PTS ascorbate transporter subunit IIC [Clostridia bacterium]|nr:PTS ascorbate transporter subunit IIC [Clostridia bacterium]